VQTIFKDGVKVEFEILKKNNNKISCTGWFDYTMINLQTGRSEIIPDWITEKYSV
jgi:acyl-CoA thioester hydrolase/thioesterase-3